MIAISVIHREVLTKISNTALFYRSGIREGEKQVDIELPEELPLIEAHVIGESLQIKIEELPEVERAFVHLDYECDHKPEHSVLSKIPNSRP